MSAVKELRRLAASLLPVLLRRPWLAPTALRQAFVLAPRGWWRQWPPVPAPAEDYLHFRSVTAYGGDGTTPPDPDDMAAWLGWVRAWPSVTGSEPRHTAGETTPSPTGKRN